MSDPKIVLAFDAAAAALHLIPHNPTFAAFGAASAVAELAARAATIAGRAATVAKRAHTAKAAPVYGNDAPDIAHAADFLRAGLGIGDTASTVPSVFSLRHATHSFLVLVDGCAVVTPLAPVVIEVEKVESSVFTTCRCCFLSSRLRRITSLTGPQIGQFPSLHSR
eukprot:CAMPEP_0172537086 /NCGR_PEP_ID=MMETSP1067-20121228/8765_1 /TAXON_ID=265564 ORGANISM="Thalassiosira punctigera, Strain Tpunct2005C2" /NCGR_SAMPLE_ID=MMETSP1067 /ASSEMBLY_ACC=CAM_ASM_000444 /LENGTH=165 /DNA_ID=CAMNT_0013322313 /DNA_START=173 /DNA_END=671 /DNA_ORIENTATION=+